MYYHPSLGDKSLLGHKLIDKSTFLENFALLALSYTATALDYLPFVNQIPFPISLTWSDKRIVELLSSNAFKFAPTTLKLIHKELFFGLLPQGIPLGEYRSYNITKNEAVLNGDSVIYDDFRTVADSLVYDFQQESQFDYQ